MREKGESLLGGGFKICVSKLTRAEVLWHIVRGPQLSDTMEFDHVELKPSCQILIKHSQMDLRFNLYYICLDMFR